MIKKRSLAKRWSCCRCWVSSCVLCCGMWCPCVGEMNVLACSYHCWFPGRLNGQCSGAVRMNGWPLSSHDNLLPTHCSNPPPGPLIWLILIPSYLLSFLPSFFLPFFSFFLSFFLSVSVLLPDLSALAKKIKLEAMASYHSNQQHGGPNGENGDHNTGLGEFHPRNRHTHTHIHIHASEMLNYGRITDRVDVVWAHLRRRVKRTWAAVFLCCC